METAEVSERRPVRYWVGRAVLTALGAGLWLAALNVRYRDIRYTLPLLTSGFGGRPK